MQDHPDIWLSPAQAILLLSMGRLAQVASLSDAEASLVWRVPLAEVPLSPDASPVEQKAAFQELRRQMTAQREPIVAEIDRLYETLGKLLATGLVRADGRRTVHSPYEVIRPLEFRDRRLRGGRLEDDRGEILFWNVRVSGRQLLDCRQQAVGEAEKPGSQASELSASATHEAAVSEALLVRTRTNKPGVAGDARGSHWRRKWRRQWVARFAKRQRHARRWIAFVDLVDWCAQSTTTASLDAEAKAREVAYQRLTDSMRRGEFEHDGRSRILYLDTLVISGGWSPRCRLTREQFEIALDGAATPPNPSLPFTVLNCCWLPRELARQWLESHGYHWSPRFEPPPKRSPPQNIEEFDLLLGWIPVTAALEIIKAAVGGLAWEQLKQAIQLKSLPTRCRADGVNRDLEPYWLDFLAFDDPEGDCLSFDRLTAAEAKLHVPDLATEVVVSIARCAELWPDAAWQNPSAVKAANDDARSEREFRSPDWSLGNVLSWIAFRDPALICRFEGRHELLTYRRYDHPRSRNLKRPMLDPRADQKLLDVLKDGGLTAIRNGAEIPSAHWFGKYPSHLSNDLRFRGAEVIGCWTLDGSEAAATPRPQAVGTGMPGRLSLSKHLIEDEFRRRTQADQASLSLSDEAKALLAWFAKHHPEMQRPTLKTIENNIRDHYRTWKASRTPPVHV